MQKPPCRSSSTKAPRRLWFVFNPGSHSVEADVLDRVRTRLSELGGTIVGETRFPDQSIPDGAALDDHDVDTLVTLGGDGTITCAATELAGWKGRLLVLAGGTMNLIPKMLHADLDPDAIVTAAFARPRLTALPYIAVGEHRSFARIIAGPAASFVHVREELRAGRVSQMWRALRFAWRMLWSRTIALDGEVGRFRAIFVRAGDDEELLFETIEAGGPLSALKLAWTWTVDLMGDTAALDQRHRGTALLRSSRPVRMLLDGEEMFFDAPVALEPRTSGLCFFTTRDDQDEEEERA